MKEYIMARALELARHIIDAQSTVRDTAQVFGVSKSTVHKDVTERLEEVNYGLYLQVQEILKINLNERHIRGGIATREKYLGKK